MAFVVTQNCCNDTACVDVCPVNCIHPTPDEPAYSSTEMLYIDAGVCIDCGACADACPVDAIVSDFDLDAKQLPFIDVNALFYRDPVRPRDVPSRRRRSVRHRAGPLARPLRVAIVGSGPAGSYAAADLLARFGTDVEINMFERLATPWGLARFGVAPDHSRTRAVTETFARLSQHPGFSLLLGVEVGRDVATDDLRSQHDAVIYAVGALDDRRLGIPGEGLKGSHSATEFVGWYNGHPDFASRDFDLSCERVVVIGNGNVAIDIARILLSAPERLARTDIAARALEQLTRSRVREVVVIGRRGPAESAFSRAELLGISEHESFVVDVRAEDVTSEVLDRTAAAHGHFSPEYAKVAHLQWISARTQGSGPPAGRRLSLRFLASPQEITGAGQVESVRLVRNELLPDEHGGRTMARATQETADLTCGLVLRSVGYRGSSVAGLPFDSARGVMPHERGRVVDPVTGLAVVGVYATGWIKRGPSGVLGTNKQCAQETVDRIVEDLQRGRLGHPSDLIVGGIA